MVELDDLKLPVFCIEKLPVHWHLNLVCMVVK